MYGNNFTLIVLFRIFTVSFAVICHDDERGRGPSKTFNCKSKFCSYTIEVEKQTFIERECVDGQKVGELQAQGLNMNGGCIKEDNGTTTTCVCVGNKVSHCNGNLTAINCKPPTNVTMANNTQSNTEEEPENIELCDVLSVTEYVTDNGTGNGNKTSKQPGNGKVTEPTSGNQNQVSGKTTKTEDQASTTGSAIKLFMNAPYLIMILFYLDKFIVV